MVSTAESSREVLTVACFDMPCEMSEYASTVRISEIHIHVAIRSVMYIDFEFSLFL